MSATIPIRARWRRFLKSESGSATVEAVLWIPLFFFITLFVLDASMMFNAQSRALRMVQDTNRALAVGQIASTAAATTELKSRIAVLSPSATVSATITGNIVETRVAMPISDISMFGTFDTASNFFVTASSQQRLEN